LGAAAVGFLFGVIVELCIDTDNIRDLQEKNHKLKLENEALRKKSKHEVIEIIDNRKKNDEIQFGGF
jgi:regulator of replication initiation timing